MDVGALVVRVLQSARDGLDSLENGIAVFGARNCSLPLKATPLEALVVDKLGGDVLEKARGANVARSLSPRDDVGEEYTRGEESGFACL